MSEQSDVTPDPSDPSLLPWLLTAFLTVILIALVTASVLLWRANQPREDDDGAVAVAEDAVKRFFSLDHRDPEGSIDRVLAVATGDFEDDYESKRDELVKNLVEKKLTQEATIPEEGAALAYLSEDEAQVLVAANVVTSAAAGGSEEERHRTLVTLEWVDDAWLVSDLNAVG